MKRGQAKQMRKLLENQTALMDDSEIINYPDFVEKWSGEGVSYEAGKRLCYNGVIYKVNDGQGHISQPDWTPDTAVALFSKVLIPDDTQIYEWEQPDSTNAYSKGDKVKHNGKTWVSDTDNNVWEPGVYGWTEMGD